MRNFPDRVCTAVLLCLAACFADPSAAQPIEPGVERSVVRLVNYAQRGQWYSPWDLTNVSESRGSGFVVAGGLVMTNAHVVSDSRHLLIYLHNDPTPYPAEVRFVAHDCDLALVAPIDPQVLEGVPALEIDGEAQLGAAVVTLGYPAGGNALSSTRGVVSRIEDQLYLHSSMDRHLTVQTDAAINPGNSGGPVLEGNRVVGVAFQAMPDLQSVGYFIPVEVIGRFLRDVEDGRYDGYPELGVETSTMDNPAARAAAAMEAHETGVRVYGLYPGSSADGQIRVGDVILAVDGQTVANDGTVADGSLRIPFGLLVDRLQVGEQVRVTLLREGERLEVDVPLTAYEVADKHGHSYDRLPRYYVYGGLVFVPLDLEMLKTFGAEWPQRADKALLHEFWFRPQSDRAQMQLERVVLLRRLDHAVNANMAWYRNQVVERVNGRTIDGLEDLIEAFESFDGDFHFIEFSNFSRFGVLDRRQADEANAEILRVYGVDRDRNL